MKIVQFMRMATAQASTYVGVVGQCIVDTGSFALRILDGVTPGGFSTLLSNNNLDDVADAGAARVNIGLGDVLSDIGTLNGDITTIGGEITTINAEILALQTIGSSTYLAKLPDGTAEISILQKTINIGQSSTVDVLRFLDPLGVLLGNNFISGTLNYNIIDQANGGNNTTGQIWLGSTGIGAVSFGIVPYLNSSNNSTQTVRGTALVSASPFSAVNDGGTGAAKMQITTIASGKTCSLVCDFHGLIK